MITINGKGQAGQNGFAQKDYAHVSNDIGDENGRMAGKAAGQITLGRVLQLVLLAGTIAAVVRPGRRHHVPAGVSPCGGL
jgi:hypothetical protein